MLGKPIVYALFCVVTPVVWGLVVTWVSGRIERRLLRRSRSASLPDASPDDTALSLEYHL